MEGQELMQGQLLVETNRNFKTFQIVRLVLSILLAGISTIRFFTSVGGILVAIQRQIIPSVYIIELLFTVILLIGAVAALITSILAFIVKLPNRNLSRKGRFSIALVGSVLAAVGAGLYLLSQLIIVVANFVAYNNPAILFTSFFSIGFTFLMFAGAIVIMIMSILLKKNIKVESFTEENMPRITYN